MNYPEQQSTTNFNTTESLFDESQMATDPLKNTVNSSIYSRKNRKVFRLRKSAGISSSFDRSGVKAAQLNLNPLADSAGKDLADYYQQPMGKRLRVVQRKPSTVHRSSTFNRSVYQMDSVAAATADTPFSKNFKLLNDSLVTAESSTQVEGENSRRKMQSMDLMAGKA